jgi:drug/metabolite transporter (DMT)-like permease
MTIAQVLFAIMAVAARAGGQSVPWQEVVASRFLVGALTALVVGRALRKPLRIKNVRDAWIRTIFGTLAACGTFFTLAQPKLAVGDAATLFATSPIFVALLSWPLLRERVRGGVLVAIAIAFAGIVAVAQPKLDTAGYVIASGMFTAVMSATAMVWLRRIGPEESSEAIVLHFSSFGFVVALAMSIPVWRTPDATSAAWLLATGLSGGLAQVAMTRAYSLDTAARVSAIGYSGVVFTRLFALPMFGEVPDATQIAGSLLIIVSGLVLAFRRS